MLAMFPPKPCHLGDHRESSDHSKREVRRPEKPQDLNAASDKPTWSLTATILSLTAIVRTNDTLLREDGAVGDSLNSGTRTAWSGRL